MKKSIHIYFDGECIMCNKFIRYLDEVLELSLKNFQIYAFSNLNHLKKQAYPLLIENMISAESKDTLLVVTDNIIIQKKSAAVLSLLKLSNAKYIFLITKVLDFVPTSLLDFIYDIIAKNRKKIFQSQFCEIVNFKNIDVVA